MPRAIYGFGRFMPGAEFPDDRAFQSGVGLSGPDDRMKRAKKRGIRQMLHYVPTPYRVVFSILGVLLAVSAAIVR